ncbi:MAG: hypothetical protein QXS06_05150 [Desulfurococcaceae archaeon]
MDAVTSTINQRLLCATIEILYIPKSGHLYRNHCDEGLGAIPLKNR